MSSNNYGIDDLRRRLFETIDGVKSGAVSLDQARQVSELAQVIVNTAKVEVDYVRATDAASKSTFLESKPQAPSLPDGVSKAPAVPGNGIVGIVRHTIKG